ncbi:MAG TPA: S41 family peptidase [Pyrinomonadaceae bacterium]|nr:S41 family peptidase [Pyrinomonadaceae bacterium]
MIIFAKNSFSRTCVNMTVVLTILLIAFGNALAQSISSLDIDRGNSMLRAIRSDIEQNYYDPKFRGIDIEALFKQAKDRINKADSNGQIFGIIALTLIEFNDSHLIFLPPQRATRIEYGWNAQMIGNRCFVVAVKPGSDADLKGLKEGDLVHFINDMKPSRSEFWKLQYLLNVLRPEPSLRVVVQSAGKEPRELKIDAKIQQTKRVTDLTDYNEVIRLEIQEQRDARLWRHRYIEMDDVFIWKMPQFDLAKAGVDDMVGKFRKRKALILDLRGNSGGYEETLLRLLGSFFENEVKVGDLITRKQTKPMIVKSTSNDAFKGQVIVLIDSNSASSSELLARVIQLEKRGTVIGDNSAGSVMRARHHSHTVGLETVTFYGVTVTDADLTMTDGSRLEGAGVTPDEFLIPNQLDLATGRDPVMARALALAGVNMSAEKARTLFPVEWKK